jgi:flagellar protein FlaG
MLVTAMIPNQPGPRITLNKTTEYRENYANSVQVRVNLWDFFLSFGILDQNTPEAVQINNFQGIYLSPQQAKALANVLNQNISQYETAFGEIRLEPQAGAASIQ